MLVPARKIRQYGLRLDAEGVRARSPELDGPPCVVRNVTEALLDHVEAGRVEAWDYNGEVHFIAAENN